MSLTGLNLNRKLSETSIFSSTSNSFEKVIRALENSGIDNTGTIAVLHALEKVKSSNGSADIVNTEIESTFLNDNREVLNAMTNGFKKNSIIANPLFRMSTYSLQNEKLFSASVEKNNTAQTESINSGFNFVSLCDTSDNSTDASVFFQITQDHASDITDSGDTMENINLPVQSNDPPIFLKARQCGKSQTTNLSNSVTM